MIIRIFFPAILILLNLLCACDMRQYPHPENEQQREILVYSGMTMIQPLLEIVELFEEREDCSVKISYGGSGHILRSVEVNQVGDIFFPGESSYLDALAAPGVVIDSARVGYNEAGFFVPQGNPLKISGHLENLLDKKLRVVIGNHQSGSIGRETRSILEKAGLYQGALDNALYMTTDSKGLSRAIRERDADLVMNWKAVKYLPGNAGLMDFIELPEAHALRRPMTMGLLRYSRHPDLAKKFLALASSEQGQLIFRKYGFVD